MKLNKGQVHDGSNVTVVFTIIRFYTNTRAQVINILKQRAGYVAFQLPRGRFGSLSHLFKNRT